MGKRSLEEMQAEEKAIKAKDMLVLVPAHCCSRASITVTINDVSVEVPVGSPVKVSKPVFAVLKNSYDAVEQVQEG